MYGNSQNASLAEVASVAVNLQRELPTEWILPVSPLKQDQPAPEGPVQCLCRLNGFPRWHCVGTDRLTDTGEVLSRIQSTERWSGQNLWSGSLLKTLSSVTETLGGFCVWIHYWRSVIVLVGGCLLIDNVCQYMNWQHVEDWMQGIGKWLGFYIDLVGFISGLCISDQAWCGDYCDGWYPHQRWSDIVIVRSSMCGSDRTWHRKWQRIQVGHILWFVY